MVNFCKGGMVLKRNLMGFVDLKEELKSNNNVVVEYFRTEEEETDENYNPKKPLGIEVVKKEDIDGITYRETKLVKHIGNSAEKIDKILELLRRNSVTPICVADVLEDLRVI